MDVVVFSALVWKFIDFLRNVANFAAQKSAVVTQLLAWIGGVLAVVLAAHASATSGLTLPGANEALGSLDGPSQILVGLLLASTASAAVDVKSAIDGTDSASQPPLIPPSAPPPPPAA